MGFYFYKEFNCSNKETISLIKKINDKNLIRTILLRDIINFNILVKNHKILQNISEFHFIKIKIFRELLNFKKNNQEFLSTDLIPYNRGYSIYDINYNELKRTKYFNYLKKYFKIYPLSKKVLLYSSYISLKYKIKKQNSPIISSYIIHNGYLEDLILLFEKKLKKNKDLNLIDKYNHCFLPLKNLQKINQLFQ